MRKYDFDKEIYEIRREFMRDRIYINISSKRYYEEIGYIYYLFNSSDINEYFSYMF